MTDDGVDARQQLVKELRRAKQASGLSFATLGSRAYCSRASAERYVNGKQFPPKVAVEALARACDVDPEPLLRLWDAAVDSEVSAPPAIVSRPPVPVSTPTSRARPRKYAGIVGSVLGVLLGVPLLSASGVAPAVPKPPASTNGCRDYYIDFHVYTLGRLCWTATDATVSGQVTNQGGPDQATVQVCVSDHPNLCAQTITVAAAGPDLRTRYTRVIALPAGYGAWVRACAGDYCSTWK
ncbi:helix-turn-helix transcriptional regulator [Kutzneria buriramensis]|uniref:Transcriptional regulator with XRE-family HTH domain n=1 Tax=Kutzneria buriramensis TaxID=1045776 RepID=A0A3E0GWY1_9PSEU|nr:helix-turn-helix transcriptional regulator [Kutzneria buriramensis]REH29621.1 transcriptional regulator with XRE-family HTH domain [Kutzneria buriramensis]